MKEQMNLQNQEDVYSEMIGGFARFIAGNKFMAEAPEGG